jgi:hypothetical protein
LLTVLKSFSIKRAVSLRLLFVCLALNFGPPVDCLPFSLILEGEYGYDRTGYSNNTQL